MGKCRILSGSASHFARNELWWSVAISKLSWLVSQSANRVSSWQTNILWLYRHFGIYWKQNACKSTWMHLSNRKLTYYSHWLAHTQTPRKNTIFPSNPCLDTLKTNIWGRYIFKASKASRSHQHTLPLSAQIRWLLGKAELWAAEITQHAWIHIYVGSSQYRLKETGKVFRL